MSDTKKKADSRPEEKIISRRPFPGSEKVYMPGKNYPIQVPMRTINLVDTVKIVDGKRVHTPNDPVYVYDTSGVYTDPKEEIDLHKGLKDIRSSWIKRRGDAEELPRMTSEYGSQRLNDKSLDHLRFEHIRKLFFDLLFKRAGDHLELTIPLECFTRNVQCEIFGIDHAFYEAEAVG